MPPKRLDFPLIGHAFMTLFHVGVALFAGAVAVNVLAGAGAAAEGGGRRAFILHLAGGWPIAILFGCFAIYSLVQSAICLWRFFSSDAAVMLDRERLVIHRSFWNFPSDIRLSEISSVTLLRGNEVFTQHMRSPTDAALSVVGFPVRASAFGERIALRFRAFLVIEFRRGATESGRLSLSDNQIDGGIVALRSFFQAVSVAKDVVDGQPVHSRDEMWLPKGVS